MGTDELVTIVKTTRDASRDAIRKLIVDVWKPRGARIEARSAPAKAIWRSDEQTRFGYAISRASKRGWVTLVESAGDSLGIDEAVLRSLRAKTAVWVSWSYDHAAMYGQKAFTKSREPVDFASDGPYRSLIERRAEWDFVVLGGVCPLDFARFAPTARTKSDPWPRDPERDLDGALSRAILAQRVDEALAIVQKLGANVSDGALSTLFDRTYPLQWKETRETILTLGAAVARERPLAAEHWVRMLEVAAVADDQSAARSARDALARHPPSVVEAAVREARDRLREGQLTEAAKRFARWSRGLA